MTRLKQAERPDEPAPVPGDYFVLETEVSAWYISTDMARAVDAALATTPAPEWITFVDLAGARVRLRARRVEALTQCTAEQRSLRRSFHRALDQERAAERNWDDND